MSQQESKDAPTTGPPVATDTTTGISSKKNLRGRSEVWDHFTKFKNEDGDLTAKCNYCPKTFPCASKKYGTSTLRGHMVSCIHNPKNNEDGIQTQLNLKHVAVDVEGTAAATGGLGIWKFDQTFCRKKLVEMIIKDELAFRFVEGDGFIEFVAAARPRFVIPSRWSISRDVFQIFLDMKLELHKFFATSKISVCITTDTWTSIQNMSYYCITAHYVDDDWNLNKKIINFETVDSHKGEDMGRKIDDCLRDWRISRVFSVTVDNAAANDTCLTYLKGRFTSRGVDVVKGQHLHMSCAAHVVNLIVVDGLKVINPCIKRIRDAIRFVRNSPQRMTRFKECCKEENIDCRSMLCLDVPTRWNSTYLMLSVGLKFEKGFERYETKDPFFKHDLSKEPALGVPTHDDWVVAKGIVDILVTFYETTLRVSASLHVTSHLIYHDIDSIGDVLKELVQSENANIREMGSKMQFKYNKYWGRFEIVNKLIYLAVVIDPRYKLGFISYALGEKHTYELKVYLDELYEHYRLLHEPKTQSGVSNQDMPSPSKKLRYAKSEMWKQQSQGKGPKNDLDIYLSEEVLTGEKDKFDILKWWDVHQCRFPILAHLARDLLSMPISTVPSESAFSTGGRVLDPFRSSLSPELVEALICAQDWLRREKKEITVEEDLISLEKHLEGIEKLINKENGQEEAKE